jgi:hypothetical protein
MPVGAWFREQASCFGSTPGCQMGSWTPTPQLPMPMGERPLRSAWVRRLAPNWSSDAPRKPLLTMWWSDSGSPRPIRREIRIHREVAGMTGTVVVEAEAAGTGVAEVEVAMEEGTGMVMAMRTGTTMEAAATEATDMGTTTEMIEDSLAGRSSKR